MNGRRRSGAWFQKRPLSASPYGLPIAALCLPGLRDTSKAGQSKHRGHCDVPTFEFCTVAFQPDSSRVILCKDCTNRVWIAARLRGMNRSGMIPAELTDLRAILVSGADSQSGSGKGCGCATRKATDLFYRSRNHSAWQRPPVP